MITENTLLLNRKLQLKLSLLCFGQKETRLPYSNSDYILFMMEQRKFNKPDKEELIPIDFCDNI